MNIFTTSSDPHSSAIALDDKRIQKMFVESMQMMAVAINMHGEPKYAPKRVADGQPYGSVHVNHPCTVWVRSGKDNFRWMWAHAHHLYQEHVRRRNGPGPSHWVHFDNLKRLEDCVYDLDIPSGLTLMPNCSIFKNEPDLTQAYRYTMAYKWFFTDVRKPVWTKSKAPDWTKKCFEVVFLNTTLEPKRWPDQYT